MAILLALKMAEKSPPHYKECRIYVDNQASIKSVTKPNKQPTQYIRSHIVNCLDQLQDERPTMKIQIEWIPGHMDIAGNDKADEEAKRAAQEQITGSDTYTYYTLKAAQNRKINADIGNAARIQWTTTTTTARHHRQLTRPRRVKTGLQLYNNLSRKRLSTLIRLRTEHCGLNHYLHRFNIIEDPECECGHGIETVKHFLLDCKSFEEERKELRKEVGWRNMRKEKLLGNPKFVKNTIEFADKTERFKFK